MHFSSPFRFIKKLCSGFKTNPSRAIRRRASFSPRLELMEDKLAPALAHVAPLTFHGVPGSASLSNTGQLTFTPTAPGPTKTLDTICSAFNVDTAGNLWLLESNGYLKQLTAGPAQRWILRDTNVGSFSLSASGVLEDVKLNGTLRRFANGAWDKLPLATGVTKADVDVDGNIYGLINGNLWKWAPGQTTSTLLNNGASGNGNEPGNVVSFQVGNDTVAWMLGLLDPNSAKVRASYTNGTNPQLITDNNASGLIAVYSVAADGSIIVADPGATTFTGVTLLTLGQFNVDNGTDLRVNGAALAGSSFQLSPDGKAIAVLSGSSRNLSAYTIAGNHIGTEKKLTTNGTAQSFGIANDLKVYDFSTTAVLRFYDPFAAVPVLTPTQVSPAVAQWQLGPNGQPAFLTQTKNFTVATQTIANVAQIGFAPNGRLYYLGADGKLFQGTGIVNNPGTYRFVNIDRNSTAFAVNNTSALVDIRSNGDVWRLTGAASTLPALTSARTVFGAWTRLFTGGDIGVTIGSKQAVGDTGTPLFVLPDGNFYFLASGQFIRLTANHSTIFSVGQFAIDWESNPNTKAGVTVNEPAFNSSLGGGTFFSALSTKGFDPIGVTLF